MRRSENFARSWEKPLKARVKGELARRESVGAGAG